jgi:S-adenosylmethionine hydrolase
VAEPIITLTTDFGEDSPYVAAMKGVILKVNPQARIVDLSHQIPPQDVRHAAFFLRHSLPYFPPGVLHVVVVDPGVGSERAILYICGGGQHLLVPDNGCWTTLPMAQAPDLEVIHVTEQRYWRQPVSATFHGRDIFAPVAGHLSLGVEGRRLGPGAKAWVRLEIPPSRLEENLWRGEIVFVDHFGNLITNLPGVSFRDSIGCRLDVELRDKKLRPRCVRAYADAEPGEIVVLVSSADTLEIALRNGSAAGRLGVGSGTAVQVRLPEP